MLWLLLFSVIDTDLSGTWKVREPVAMEAVGEVCRFRNTVAHLTQVGDRISGRYEAMVSCSDPQWPDSSFRRRIGTVEGTHRDGVVTLTIDGWVSLRGQIDGTVLSGSVDNTDGLSGRWSASRVRH